MEMSRRLREKSAEARLLTRRQMMQGLAVVGGLAAAGIKGPSSWAAQAPARQPGLLLPPGSLPDPSLPEGVDTMPQIEHVILYMQENRSYDHYFGWLPRGDGYTFSGGVPTNTNPDLDGNPVGLYHNPSGCDTIPGASQGWDSSHIEWNNGAMDGFVKAAGSNTATGSMTYYDNSDIPFYYSLANTFPLCDRWFCSMLGQTFPNRRYWQAATSMGIVSTDIQEVLDTPDAPNGTIWDRLDAHGITWKDYAIDLYDVLLFPTFYQHMDQPAHLKTYLDFLVDLRDGTLPQVSIISPGHTKYSEESPADIQNGEYYSYAIIRAVMKSPLWSKTALIFTYDEHGGYYDHVPPPAAVAPDNILPRITVPPDQAGDFGQYGIRVPGFVISPYARANYVSSVVHDHTSALKFIETKWNLGAMTYRDANADNLLDCFDFNNPGFLTPPTLALPGLPATGSACQPLELPPLDPPAPAPTTTTAPPTTAPPTTINSVKAQLVAALNPTPVTATPRFTG